MMRPERSTGPPRCGSRRPRSAYWPWRSIETRAILVRLPLYGIAGLYLCMGWVTPLPAR